MAWAMKALLCLLSLCGVLAAQDTISKDDIRKTVEHIQQLARDSQTRADLLNDENKSLAEELGHTRQSLAAAQAEKADAQKKVQSVTDWGNKQADNASYWHAKQQEAVGKLVFWRVAFWGLVLLIVAAIALKFTSLGAKLALRFSSVTSFFR